MHGFSTLLQSHGGNTVPYGEFLVKTLLPLLSLRNLLAVHLGVPSECNLIPSARISFMDLARSCVRNS